MSDANSANIPGAGPLVDSNGRVTQPWYLFFLALMNRTGGSGTPTDITQLTQFATAIEKEANTAVPVQPKPVSITEGVTAIQKPAAPDFSQNMVYQVPGAYITGNSPTISQPNIVGVTNGSNATTGSVGEPLFGPSNGTSVGISTGSVVNLVSLTLAAGDWDIWGSAQVINTSSALSNVAICLSSTSGALGTPDTITQTSLQTSIMGIYAVPTPTLIKNIAASTTYYIVVQSSFSAGTTTAKGYIYARRRH